MKEDFFNKIYCEINDLEHKINIESYYFNSIELWPIFRLGYYIYRKKMISRYSKQSTLKKIVDKFKRINLKFSYSFKRKINFDKIKTLYVGANTHRTLINGNYINRYFNHLLNDSSKLIEYNNRFNKLESGAVDIEFISRDYSYLTKSEIKSLNILKNDLISLNLDTKLINEVVKYTLSVINYCSYFESFLSTTKISKIYLLSYYSAPALGICIAANKLNIKTIEVQHGPISKFHLAYSMNFKKKLNSFKAIPDEIHLWHNSFEKIVSDSFKAFKTTGNYYLNEYIDTNRKSNRSKILISLQPKDGILPELYLNIILQFYNKYSIVLRLHPRINISNYLKKQIKNIRKIYGVTISNPYKIPLHEDLRDVFVHITGYSGTTIEALSLGITSLLVDQKANHFFENFIDEEKIIFCDKMSNKKIFQLIEKIKCSQKRKKV